jgi:hypothetical protein
MPGGNTGSVAARTATFATEVALTGGVNSGPTSGNLVNGFAFCSTCSDRKFLCLVMPCWKKISSTIT